MNQDESVYQSNNASSLLGLVHSCERWLAFLPCTIDIRHRYSGRYETRMAPILPHPIADGTTEDDGLGQPGSATEDGNANVFSPLPDASPLCQSLRGLVVEYPV